MTLPKPLLLYDGDCGFCRRWIARWRRLTGDRVDYAPYQEAAARFPMISLQKFEAAMQLVEPDGHVSSSAEAVFRTLVYGGKHFPLWCYRHLPGFACLSECAYRFIAAHRGRGTCTVPEK